MPIQRLGEDGKTIKLRQISTSPKQTWNFGDLAAEVKKKVKTEEDIVFAVEKNGKLVSVFKACELLSNVSPKDNLCAFEVKQLKQTDYMVELNFYRHEVIKKKQKTIEETEIQRSAMPRLVSFPKTTSFAKISQKVLQMYGDLFSQEVIEGEKSPLKLEVRDNLPTV